MSESSLELVYSSGSSSNLSVRSSKVPKIISTVEQIVISSSTSSTHSGVGQVALQSSKEDKNAKEVHSSESKKISQDLFISLQSQQECLGSSRSSSISSLQVQYSSDSDTSEPPGKKCSDNLSRNSPNNKDSPDLFGSSQVSVAPEIPSTVGSQESDSELWSTQHLAQVSKELQGRSKQLKTLLLKLIKRRQLSEDSLECFKKRLRKM